MYVCIVITQSHSCRSYLLGPHRKRLIKLAKINVKAVPADSTDPAPLVSPSTEIVALCISNDMEAKL